MSKIGIDRDVPGTMSYDLKLLFPVLCLAGIGVVMVFSASSALAGQKFGSHYYFLKRQAFFLGLGSGVLFLCRHIPYGLFKLAAYPLLALSAIFLAALHVPFLGYAAAGSTRWLDLGLFSFQPSEMARFAMIVFLASSMSKNPDSIKRFSSGFLPHMIALGVFTALIFMEPDFGSAVILAAVTWIMLFVGGGRLRHLAGSLALLLPVFFFFMINAQYRVKRILTFLNPWENSAGDGYQIVHSLMAFGSGGIWGMGIGKGYQKLFYLPEPHTDFIFSVIGEEMGLAGALFILALYSVIVWQGIKVSLHAKDAFGSFLSMGLITAIGLQACVNMAMTMGLLPTKGLALPFLSYGGTSLLINMASVGILMNIGANQEKKAYEKR
ncbi:putative peptidoglycan glycosyltransferase FtsW [Candidatus Desulfarcum epimagneticum]|uniref:Probable peptidoglycan glycosyltransferase FtsW n=1 Tax=uncultured Desulfobacteraceae bacterium TaxID=218296 RepID=A0A484HLH1_9BACT|nr:putative peptidoglycan glycosyltransferase FtsW [uncultured Desulfobacteraceae bacterium]